MGIRSKISKKFSSRKTGSNSSKCNSTSGPRRTDIEYYKENEIPKSKYRGKVDKAHQEQLDSYSLGEAFQTIARRPSQALSGTFSPGGTGSQSKRGSCIHGATSASGPMRLDNEDEKEDQFLRRKSAASVGVPKEETVDEENDTLVNNSTDANIPQITLQKTVTARPSSPTSSPFTREELEQAMSRATMRPRRGTVMAPAIQPEAIAA